MIAKTKSINYLPKIKKSFSCPYCQCSGKGWFCLAFVGRKFKNISLTEKTILCANSSHLFCKIYKNITGWDFQKTGGGQNYVNREKKKNEFMAMPRYSVEIKKGGS